MSVDYTAVIARGFLINERPYGKLPDEFIDEWVIDFDGWTEHDDGYLIGYYLQRAWWEGVPMELTPFMGNKDWDDNLRKACEDIGLEVGEIKTYFGVRIS